ncbi:MAG: cation:proton antiporter [Sedimentisphaerales bacterium]|nr:cation:proton antiporter [Sedimentisphaerales bacterium]
MNTFGHLNILLLLGIAAFGGTIGAKIFQKLRIPQVVGYIFIGILFGSSGLKLIDAQTVQFLAPFNMFALGIIGFMIGGELKIDVFKKYGTQFITILLAEGLFAFFFVSVLCTVICKIFMPDVSWHFSLALGLLLGAISSATAPAATVDVLWEYKTRGVLTRAVLAIVALDDGLALLLYGVVASIAGILTGTSHNSLIKAIFMPAYEIFGAAGIGIVTAAVLVILMKFIIEHDKILTFTLSSVLLIIGLSIALNVDSILAAMVFGAVIANFRPRMSLDTFKMIEKFAPPIYVLFFVLVGAQLQIASMQLWAILLAVSYVIGRTAGKMSGSWLGAVVSKSPMVLRKYLGFCLFSQAGVAIGLAILASQKFEGPVGQIIILVVTSTTFLVQIIGPPFVKLGVKLAGEVGMNVTEEDLIAKYTVKDVMDSNPATIREDTTLDEILNVFSTTDAVYYPVIDDQSKLTGIISINSIKETFAYQNTASWLLACDIAQPALDKTTWNTPLTAALDRMKKYDLEYLPVVSGDDNKLLGIIDERTVNRKISAEVIRKHEEADEMAAMNA